MAPLCARQSTVSLSHDERSPGRSRAYGGGEHDGATGSGGRASLWLRRGGRNLVTQRKSRRREEQSISFAKLTGSMDHTAGKLDYRQVSATTVATSAVAEWPHVARAEPRQDREGPLCG